MKLTGAQILAGYDSAAEEYSPDVQQQVLELGFQVYKDGVWRDVPIEDVRLISRSDVK